MDKPSPITCIPTVARILAALLIANLVVCATNGVTGAEDAVGTYTSFTGTGVSDPHGIVLGPDGALWFTNAGNNSIGRITTDGAISNFTGTGISAPEAITVGSDGALWFTNYGNDSIGRITTAGEVSNFTDVGIGGPFGITSGSDGALWFTNLDGQSIGRITTTGTVSSFSGTWVTNPNRITSGPDGALWFTTGSPSTVGRITTLGSLSTFGIGGSGQPKDIVTGPDGALWFALFTDSRIGRLLTDGTWDRYTAATTYPYGMTVGPDGNFWITSYKPLSNRTYLVRMTASGATTTFATSPASDPRGITTGPDGAVWFTNGSTNSIGRMQAAVGLPAAPGTPTAVGGNGAATVTWTEPTFTGGSPITGYTVTASPGGATCTWTGGPLSCIVSGLSNGSTYTVTVTATNANGTGPPSSDSNGVTPSGSLPTQPLSVGATGGDGQATVSWSPPTSDGGTPVTSYVAMAYPGGATCSWTTGPLTCLLIGLDNGGLYRVTVQATNANGSSVASSPPATVTPSALPDAPDAPAAVPAKASATVTWTAPAFDGGAPITGYTVTASPDNSTCTWSAGPLSCSVAGLAAGVSYTFTVTATNANGTGPSSPASNAAVPWSGLGFHGVAPFRVWDSRSGPGPVGVVGAGSSVSVPVAGQGTIPVSAKGVVLNVTVTGGTQVSYVTAYPTGGAVAESASLLFAPGQTVPNLVTVGTGTDGMVSFFNQQGAVNVIADVLGYFDDGTGPGDLFNSIAPTRLLDSRHDTGGWASTALGNSESREVDVWGQAGIPNTATAVVMNVTATGGSAASFLTAYPSGAALPGTANVLFAPGQTVPNLVAVSIGSNGKVTLYNHQGSVDVIADVVGYFDPTTGSRFHPVTPVRALDSRNNTGAPWTGLPLGPDSVRTLVVSQVPAGATGIVANVTATGGSSASYLSVSPTPGSVPAPTANLLFAPGQTVPNAVMVGLGSGAGIDLYNQQGDVHAVVDLDGYYAPW